MPPAVARSSRPKSALSQPDHNQHRAAQPDSQHLTTCLSRPAHAQAVPRLPARGAVLAGAVAIIGAPDCAGLSRAIDDAVEALVAEGRIDKWRHEDFAVAPRWGQKPLFKLDRGAIGFFGIRAYGV